jgi:hypothetical protein
MLDGNVVDQNTRRKFRVTLYSKLDGGIEERLNDWNGFFCPSLSIEPGVCHAIQKQPCNRQTVEIRSRRKSAKGCLTASAFDPVITVGYLSRHLANVLKGMGAKSPD